MAGRLSHYSALYEVQNEQPGLPLDVAHLHHMVHGRSPQQQIQCCCNIIPAGLQQPLHMTKHSSDTFHVSTGVVAGASNALGPLYFATFCALSVTLGALLYNLTNVLNEYFALQQQLSDKTEVGAHAITTATRPCLISIISSSRTAPHQLNILAHSSAAAAPLCCTSTITDDEHTLLHIF